MNEEIIVKQKEDLGIITVVIGAQLRDEFYKKVMKGQRSLIMRSLISTYVNKINKEDQEKQLHEQDSGSERIDQVQPTPNPVE